MEADEQDMVEKVFADSPNDYATVLAIACRARQILDEYPKYEDKLDEDKATMVALKEFVKGGFKFEAQMPDGGNDED